MDSQPIKVVLADDNPNIRAGVKNILENQDDIVVVGEACDGRQALKLIEEVDPDILILDIEMPEFNGLEVAGVLKKVGSSLPILVLSAYDDNQYILEMLKFGVTGYLTKDEVPEVLIDAIRGVARGEYGWVSSRVAMKIVRMPQMDNLKSIDLTCIEEELLRLLAQQYTDQEIANTMGISTKAVVGYIQRLKSKLSQNSRLGLIIQARIKGYI